MMTFIIYILNVNSLFRGLQQREDLVGFCLKITVF